MSLPAGRECYAADAAPIKARGHQLVADDIDDAACSAVSEVLWDAQGKAELETLLSEAATTEFETDRIQAILESDVQDVEDWRVGEAFAQRYLEDHEDCMFPWAPRRDLKNPMGSHPGAELVGFRNPETPRFAFGEVKTSSQQNAPPSVIYGDDGLRAQIKELRDESRVTRNLVKWLGMRAHGASWEADYKSAAAAFLVNGRDFVVFGVLVRDVEPDPADLSGSAEDLASDTIAPTVIELHALYVPPEHIPEFGKP